MGSAMRKRFRPPKIGGWYTTRKSAPTSIASAKTASLRSTATNTVPTTRVPVGSTSNPTLSQSCAKGSGASRSIAATTSCTVAMSPL